MLTAKEVASMLKVSVKTVRRYAESGRLTPIRIGERLVRFNEEEIEKLMKGELND